MTAKKRVLAKARDVVHKLFWEESPTLLVSWEAILCKAKNGVVCDSWSRVTCFRCLEKRKKI